MCGREGLKIKITEYVNARNEAIPAHANQGIISFMGPVSRLTGSSIRRVHDCPA